MSKKIVADFRMVLSRLAYTCESAGLTKRHITARTHDEKKWNRLLAFQSRQLGMFIHFNSATFQFANENTKDWCYGVTDKRDRGYRPFSPHDFCVKAIDFKQWAGVAKSAGCKFAVLTAKHHEGFALWPSEATDHCIRHSPYPNDIVKEYVEAMREEGLLPGLYFSMLDLHHDITETGVSADGKKLIKAQLTELLTNYGEIPYLVIDGWHSTWGGPRFSQLNYDEIARLIQSLQPDILIMNHSCECSYDHSDIIMFENAAGQSVPKHFDGFGAAGNILTKAWFWKYSHPTAKLKSADWVVRKKLEPMNEKGVTFLLNVSPNQQGRIEKNVADVFALVGRLRSSKDV